MFCWFKIVPRVTLGTKSFFKPSSTVPLDRVCRNNTKQDSTETGPGFHFSFVKGRFNRGSGNYASTCRCDCCFPITNHRYNFSRLLLRQDRGSGVCLLLSSPRQTGKMFSVFE